MDNKEKFLKILSSYSKIKITEDLKLKEDIQLDSLDLVELILECEEEFEIVIPEDRLHQVSTVRDIMILIDDLIASN